VEVEIVLETEWADKGFSQAELGLTHDGTAPFRLPEELASAACSRSLYQNSVLRYLQKDARKYDGLAGSLGI
jgi:hypothetical protein